MYGCTFPGNTISCDGAVRCGETTETVGTAISAVSVRNAALVWTRSKIPDASTPANTRKIAKPISHPRRDRRCGCTGIDDSRSGSCTVIFSFVCVSIGITLPIPFRQIPLLLNCLFHGPALESMQNAEKSRDEKQC